MQTEILYNEHEVSDVDLNGISYYWLLIMASENPHGMWSYDMRHASPKK